MLLTKVQKLKPLPSKVSSSEYPFNLEFIKNFEEITFDTPVTFILGENGSGKSTLLESISVGLNSIAIGSDDVSRDPSLANAKKLAEYLKFTWNVKKSRSYFLRAEDVFGFVKKSLRFNQNCKKWLRNIMVKISVVLWLEVQF